MDISKESLEEFKQLYLKEFGIMLGDRDALEVAQRLLGFCLIVCRPLPKKKKPKAELPTIGF